MNIGGIKDFRNFDRVANGPEAILGVLDSIGKDLIVTKTSSGHGSQRDTLCIELLAQSTVKDHVLDGTLELPVMQAVDDSLGFDAVLARRTREDHLDGRMVTLRGNRERNV